jgi:tRNA threonylcarbamoyladenosine biosynthesis protein TsaB
MNTFSRLVIAAIDSRLGDWFCAIGEGDATPFATSARDLAILVGDQGRPIEARLDRPAEAGPVCDV